MKRFTSTLLSVLCILSGSSSILAKPILKNSNPVFVEQKSKSSNLPLIIGLAVGAPIVAGLAVIGCFKYSEKKAQDAKAAKEKEEKKEIQEGKKSEIIKGVLKRNNVNNISELSPIELEKLLNQLKQYKEALELTNKTSETDKNISDVNAQISVIEEMHARSAPAPNVDPISAQSETGGNVKTASQSSVATESTIGLVISETKDDQGETKNDGVPPIYLDHSIKSSSKLCLMPPPSKVADSAQKEAVAADPGPIKNRVEPQKKLEIKSITLFGDSVGVQSLGTQFPVEELPVSSIPEDLKKNQLIQDEYLDKVILSIVNPDGTISVFAVINFDGPARTFEQIHDAASKVKFTKQGEGLSQTVVIKYRNGEKDNSVEYADNLKKARAVSLFQSIKSYQTAIPQIVLSPKVTVTCEDPKFKQFDFETYVDKFCFNGFVHERDFYGGFDPDETYEEGLRKRMDWKGFSIPEDFRFDWTKPHQIIPVKLNPYRLLHSKLKLIRHFPEGSKKSNITDLDCESWTAKPEDDVLYGQAHLRKCIYLLFDPRRDNCIKPVYHFLDSNMYFAFQTDEGKIVTLPNYILKGPNPYLEHLMRLLGPVIKKNPELDASHYPTYSVTISKVGLLGEADASGNRPFYTLDQKMSTLNAITIAFRNKGTYDFEYVKIPVKNPYDGDFAQWLGKRESGATVDSIGVSASDINHLDFPENKLKEIINKENIITGLHFDKAQEIVESKNVYEEEVHK